MENKLLKNSNNDTDFYKYITFNYNKQENNYIHNLIAYYKFEKDINDYSDNNNHLIGNTYLEEPYLISTKYTTNAINLESKNYSISFWFKLTENKDIYLLEHGTFGTEKNMYSGMLHILYSETEQAIKFLNVGDKDVSISVSYTELTEWTHIVFICYKDVIDINYNFKRHKNYVKSIFLNGNQVLKEKKNLEFKWGNFDSFKINPSNKKLYISEFRIYYKALKFNEIKLLYKKDKKVDSENIYKINFPEKTKCDILIVGGGGAGGENSGGGGGGGGVVYGKDIFLEGTYELSVGNGGQLSGKNGKDS